MLDDLTMAIEKRTAHIVAARFQLENERHESRKKMAIEIKGLKAKAQAARRHLDDLNSAYDRFNEAAPAHASQIGKMAMDLDEMQSDLEFASTLMGNSAADSERLTEGNEQRSERPATTTRVALGPHPDQPEVADGASQTFRAAE